MKMLINFITNACGCLFVKLCSNLTSGFISCVMFWYTNVDTFNYILHSSWISVQSEATLSVENNLIKGKEYNYINPCWQFLCLKDSVFRPWTGYTMYMHWADCLLKFKEKGEILRNCKNYIPYPIQFPHRNIENDVPFSHLLIWFLPFFDFQCHQVRYQCLHFDRIRRNSAKKIKQVHYIY